MLVSLMNNEMSVLSLLTSDAQSTRVVLDHPTRCGLIRSDMDHELTRVAKAVTTNDPDSIERRVAEVLRGTIDQLLDGQHTGRYEWSSLLKTEKTHAGTLVEINLQREFKYPDGKDLDFTIDGIEVDCKFSQAEFGWMFPPESVGHLCLVVWASDTLAKWSMGLLRVRPAILTGGSNRDQKRTLKAEFRPEVQWLFKNKKLPPNIFLELTSSQISDIFAQRSGQKRVNRLFVHARGRLVGRAALATAARQDDFMKRARENGGARTHLRPLGFVILGYEHREIAAKLGMPIPGKNELISERLVRAQPGASRAAEIGGGWWRTSNAVEGEAVQEAAPTLRWTRTK